MTRDEAVLALAEEAGLEVNWSDAQGKRQLVGIDTLKVVLAALDLPANGPTDVADSRARLQHEREETRALIVARADEEIFFDGSGLAEIQMEGGAHKNLRLRETHEGRSSFHAPRECGYHRIALGDRAIALAVAPARAFGPRDLSRRRKLAGIAVQTYALRGGTSGGFGDFAALGAFAHKAGLAGFDALMASPAHALFGADPSRFGPYSPSTRLFFNPLYADATIEGGAKLEEPRGEGALIDWRAASRKKQSALRSAFAHFKRSGDRTAFEAFCRAGGERLLAHALFEALDAQFRPKGVHDFRSWPAGFDSPAAANIAAFAKGAHKDIEYQLFLQWLSARSAEEAQTSARKTMAIGIVADLAVGMDPQGSHAWCAPRELLHGLHVGAPPDMFHLQGQDWGLTTLSPRALQSGGYAAFIATLRAAMGHAGGVRIDHALGLRRLWVLPTGGSPSDGVYLRYAQEQMMRLIALESHRNRAVVIGEDLGTVPQGLRDELARAGILGTQVLWFERDGRRAFAKPPAWRRGAMATTTTHGLPTVAGWWTERDIAWRKAAGHPGESEESARSERETDRARLWTALIEARCATGNTPTPEKPNAAILGALKYVGRTSCYIAFAPVEDLTANVEQPNLPGTIDEHPNWRRRMKKGDLFRDRSARARVRAFLTARRK